MNKVILIGRLTKDPDVRRAQGDSATTVARYSLAVNRPFKDSNGQYQADFINCVVFGNGAELAEKYMRRGSQICVEGRIQTGSYTNKDGQKVYTTDVVVERQEFCGSKSDNNNNDNNSGNNNKPTNNNNDGFTNIPDGIDEELPFN